MALGFYWISQSKYRRGWKEIKIEQRQTLFYFEILDEYANNDVILLKFPRIWVEILGGDKVVLRPRNRINKHIYQKL